MVSFGQIHGGLNANVIPEKVVLEGTVRTLDRQVRERTIAHIHRLASGIESVTGTKLDVDFDDWQRPSVDNDPGAHGDWSTAWHESWSGEDTTWRRSPRPSMGSEDFAAYLEHVPGQHVPAGLCRRSARRGPDCTRRRSTWTKRCLPLAAKILARTMVEWSKPN